MTANSFRGVAPAFARPHSLESFIWGEHLKILLQSAPNGKEYEPESYIFSGSQTIRNRPGTFESVRQSMIRRDHKCFVVDGGHFDYVL